MMLSFHVGLSPRSFLHMSFTHQHDTTAYHVDVELD